MGRGSRGSGAAPFPLRVYMFGHLSVPAAFDEAAELDEVELDAEDEAFADGLAVAAWAIAEPPPTRTPVIAKVIAAPFSRCRICVTSSCRPTQSSFRHWGTDGRARRTTCE
jgi:hypothetical protein